MPIKKSEWRLYALAALTVTLFLGACSGSTDEEPVVETPVPAPVEPESPAPPESGQNNPAIQQPQSASPTPDAAGETAWKVIVFAGVNGEFGSFGEGSFTEDAAGNPVALGIEYDLDGAPSRIVMRNDRVYLGTGGANTRWLDVTDQVGQVSPMASTLLREEDDAFVQLREKTYGGERFRIFAKLGEVVALDDGSAMGSRILYWEDESGAVRRHVSIVSLLANGNTATIITVSDRDDGASLPDWYGSSSINARFNAMPAAPALRYGMGMAQPQAQWQDPLGERLFGATLDFIVPPANAQILGSVLSDLRDEVVDGVTDAAVDDFLDNLPPPGADLSDYLSQFASSGYRAIKNYFTEDQIKELGRSAMRNIIKKVVERGLLQIAPYLGYYGLAAILADAIIEDVIDWLFSDTHGEPHIRTFDGRRYSFQAAGEFVYFKTPAFEVQQRFLGRLGQATSAQATAVRIGEHVIESYFEPVGSRGAEMTVIIDGEETVLDTEGVSFPNGGYVARLKSLPKYQNMIAAVPGGSYVTIENLNVSQNVLFGITGDAREAIAGGLGGVPDGDAANDFTLRDRSVIPLEDAETVENLYGRFAASWRVQPDERLFTQGAAGDYLTAEFTDLPATVVRLEDFSQAERDAARQTCVEAGVLGDEALEDCSFDILATGDPAWAENSASSRVVESMATPQDLAAPNIAGLSADDLRGFDSPATAPAGSILSFAWRGPGAEDDIIFVAALSLEDNRYPLRNRHEASDPSDAEVIVPATPGDYEIRYFSDANGTVLFRKPLTITGPAIEISAPAEINAGAPLPVAWTGDALPEDDGLFIAEPDMDANRRWMGDRYYTIEDGSPADLVAPAAPGDYEIRVYSRANGLPLIRQALTVLPPQVTIDAPDAVAAGAEFAVAWTGPAADGDFLFVAPIDMDDNRYYPRGRHETEDGSPGRLNAPAEPGDYEIRYYSERNGDVLARRPLAVR